MYLQTKTKIKFNRLHSLKRTLKKLLSPRKTVFHKKKQLAQKTEKKREELETNKVFEI